LELGQPVEQLIGPNGQPKSFRLAESLSSLEFDSPLSLMPAEADTLWLEFLEPGKFRLAAQKEAPTASAADPAAESAFQLTLKHGRRVILASGSTRARLPTAGLRWPAKLPNSAPNAGFDRLICLPLVRDMELLDHQIRTAKTVLQRFPRQSATVRNEVGLGKTIEAGLIAAELRLRGLIRSIPGSGAPIAH